MSGITLWTLVVLIRGSAVPTGLVVERFASQQECTITGERDWGHPMYRWTCEPVVYKDP